MGNGASVDPGDADLDAQVSVTATRKGGKKKKTKISNSPGQDGEESSATAYLEQEEPYRIDGNADNNAYGIDHNAKRFESKAAQSSSSKTMRSNDSPQTKRGIGNSSSKSHNSYGGAADFDDIVDGEVKDDEETENIENIDDLSPTQTIIQLIPYYGQGDPANDSVVRAALSGLSIEDIDSKDDYGNTLLLQACQYRCEDLVRIMLNKGADANAVNSAGACCLHFSCYKETVSLGIAKVLMQNGANPEIKEYTYGCTPLHYGAGSGDLELCKLLLSHGAQVGSLDYYSYSCVDYAVQTGNQALTQYLQGRLDKYNTQSSVRNNFGYSSSALDMKNLIRQSNLEQEWQEYFDQASGMKYYTHYQSGECLWESDWKVRMMQAQATGGGIPQQPSSSKHSAATPINSPLPKTLSAVPENKAPAPIESAPIDPALLTHTLRTKLIAFFGKHDPAKLVEIEDILAAWKGREMDGYKELCTKYSIPEEKEYIAMLEKMAPKPALSKKASMGSMGSTPTKAVSISGEFELGRSTPIASRGAVVDASALQAAVQEAENAMRLKYEGVLEQERAAFRNSVSEKEGQISKLQSEIDILSKEKQNNVENANELKRRLENSKLAGGEALMKAEDRVKELMDQNKTVKDELDLTKKELNTCKDANASIQSTIASLTLGHEEAIAFEKQAAEERARMQRERDMAHEMEVKNVQAQAKLDLDNLNSDMAKSKAEWNKQKQEIKNQFEKMKKTKELEIEGLNKELSERKAKFAQELSVAQLQAEDNRKVAEDATLRAETAEAAQRGMQEEIAEARSIQAFNAQLHKDLQREQISRKKLHNEMEDLKGKIRVYVRVRPFSNSEAERGCTESIIKDGKLSVLVKLTPTEKKVFDFDQVFGGMEGNNQEDVFRDTKHLIMSVVDGYNVCIFAYGQTGAGKSYTMIGGCDLGSCIQENGDFDQSAGITPRAVSELFRLLNERHAQVTYEIEVQMFQLYRDNLEDLLADPKKKKKGEDPDKAAPLKITLAEHSASGLVQVDGAERLVAKTPKDIMEIFAKGSGRRTTASTKMNDESSRSHLICSLVVRLKNRRSGHESIGKLTLVDLAGSERVEKSGATGDALKEAQSINKSLSALGDVIAALTTGQSHIPYRNHDLTMLMSDSIGGNAKTLMFVNTSPADYNVNESNNSLGFATRCKNITNSVVNPQMQAQQMAALKKELARLKKEGGSGAAATAPKGVGVGGLARPV